jgi:hypothetical protein
MTQFIKEYQAIIDNVIISKLGYNIKITNKDRYDWIINEESLYRLAQRNGCRI